jgi:hypothetical protein
MYANMRVHVHANACDSIRVWSRLSVHVQGSMGTCVAANAPSHSQLKRSIAMCPVAMTTDAASLDNRAHYLVVTGTFIDAEFRFRNACLAVYMVEGSLTGIAISNYLKTTRCEYNISDANFISASSDNAAAFLLGTTLANPEYSFGCTVHSLQLCLKSACESVPAFSSLVVRVSALIKKIRNAPSYSENLNAIQRTAIDAFREEMQRFSSSDWYNSNEDDRERLFAERERSVREEMGLSADNNLRLYQLRLGVATRFNSVYFEFMSLSRITTAVWHLIDQSPELVEFKLTPQELALLHALLPSTCRACGGRAGGWVAWLASLVDLSLVYCVPRTSQS